MLPLMTVDQRYQYFRVVWTASIRIGYNFAMIRNFEIWDLDPSPFIRNKTAFETIHGIFISFGTYLRYKSYFSIM